MDFIDRIYYINLKTRPDREQHFLKEIDTFVPEFKNKVERFGAIKCDIGGIGCTLSHIEVLKNARQHGYGYVIVFEDDFKFSVSKETLTQKMKQLSDLVRTGFDFNIVMLSYNTSEKTEFNEFLYRTKNCGTASGYLVNGCFYDELIVCLEEGLQKYLQTGDGSKYINDQYWKKLQNDKWYIFNPRIGIQYGNYSDIEGRDVDYNV